jgi:hypothetical protein
VFSIVYVLQWLYNRLANNIELEMRLLLEQPIGSDDAAIGCIATPTGRHVVTIYNYGLKRAVKASINNKLFSLCIGLGANYISVPSSAHNEVFSGITINAVFSEATIDRFPI